MRVLVVGAGPTGLILGAAPGLREHLVTAVDRDPGPSPDGSWKRRGVMQFGHAHGFRPQVPLLLREACPAAYDAWIALGAEPVTVEIAAQAGVPMGVRSRRSTFGRALRAAGRRTHGLKIRTGHFDSLRQDGARVVGAMIDGVERSRSRRGRSRTSVHG